MYTLQNGGRRIQQGRKALAIRSERSAIDAERRRYQRAAEQSCSQMYERQHASYLAAAAAHKIVRPMAERPRQHVGPSRLMKERGMRVSRNEFIPRAGPCHAQRLAGDGHAAWLRPAPALWQTRRR